MIASSWTSRRPHAGGSRPGAAGGRRRTSTRSPLSIPPRLPTGRWRSVSRTGGLGGVRRYLEQNFAAEHELECWFGEPVIQGDRAAVEWWGTWIEEGTRLAMAGATVLRFDTAGLVVDHRDYWNQSDRPERPYSGW